MSNFESELEKQKRISLVILRPHKSVEDILQILKNIPKSNDDRIYNLEEIFSKKFEIPKILSHYSHNLNDIYQLFCINLAEPRKINTIGGTFFYKRKKRYFLFLNNSYWLVDLDFFRLIKEFRNYNSIIGDKNNTFWTKFYQLILDSSQIGKFDLNYIKNNYQKYGRIREDIKSRITGGYYYREQFLNSKGMKSINSIGMKSFMTGNEKFTWILDNSGGLSIFRPKIKSIKIIMEFIQDFIENEIITFQTTILDYMDDF